MTIPFDHDRFMAQWRAARDADGSKIAKAEYDLVLAAIEGRWPPKEQAPLRPIEPLWIPVARSLIGEREIPGPKHNSWIAGGWARLGAPWFNDDETPWCGFLIAHCMDAVGLPYPGKGMFARAKSWASYGVPVKAQPGAIGVKSRVGGGHVFFIIGETSDKAWFVVIEGNANNCVRIGKVRKSETEAVRWPAGFAIPNKALPVLNAGDSARSEA